MDNEIIKEIEIMDNLFCSTIIDNFISKDSFYNSLTDLPTKHIKSIILKSNNSKRKKELVAELNDIGKDVIIEYEKYLRALIKTLAETKENNAKYFMLTQFAGNDI